MLSKELEQSLNSAFKHAHDKRHEYITVEHLLLAMLDNSSAVEVLKACGGNVEQLRRELYQFLDETTPLIPPGINRETQPTLGFQRVLQRAVFHVQSSGKKEVTGANILVAIFSEQDSHAVYLLHKQDITRLDVVNFIAHGISKVKDESENDAHTQDMSEAAEDSPNSNSSSNPLEMYATNLNEAAREGRIDPLIGRDWK